MLTETKRCHSWLPVTVADQGFPVGGRGPPMQVLFGKNVCENERIGSRRGGMCRKILDVDPPMHCLHQ